MTSPKVFMEEQLALRADLAARMEMMENHLADPPKSPHFGMLENSVDVTDKDIARLREQIAEIDERLENMTRGNAQGPTAE